MLQSVPHADIKQLLELVHRAMVHHHRLRGHLLSLAPIHRKFCISTSREQPKSITGSPCPSSGKQECQLDVQGWPPTQQVEASPNCGGAGLDMALGSGDGSIRHPLQHPLSALVLSALQDDPTSPGVDAFTHAPWPKKLLYAFLPLHLIPPLLERVRLEQFLLILIAPDCHSAPWYIEMTCMLADQRWMVPQFGAIGSLPTLGQPFRVWHGW